MCADSLHKRPAADGPAVTDAGLAAPHGEPAGPEREPAAAPGRDAPDAPARDAASAPTGDAARLINPAIRAYMDTLSLQRFYGGYVIAPLPEQILNLGIGEVGGIELPEELAALHRRFVAGHDLTGLSTRYVGTLGIPETNAAMAEWVNAWLGERRFGPDSVVSLDGGQNAMEVAIRTFTAPLGSGRGRPYVLLAVPAYPYFSMIVAAQAGIQALLAYDAEQLTLGIERACNPAVGLILINAPHNPMGYLPSAQQVERINRVARAYDCAIAVDMVYASFAPAGAGRALAGLDPERTVFVDSFSKKYGLPGFRLGFALSARPELTYALRFVKTAESLTPSSPNLAFAGWLLREHGDVPGRIGRAVRERCERFLESFGAERAPGVSFLGERSNPFYLALDIGSLVARTGLNDVQITQFLQARHRVRVYPGSFVYPSTALRAATFAGYGAGYGARGPHGAGGSHGSAGLRGSAGLPFVPPTVPDGAPIVYAPELAGERVPMLRLSFGSEPRVEPAARALAAGLRALWDGARE
jgi:aspartate/methionine/tyrosine aminotransferase